MIKTSFQKNCFKGYVLVAIISPMVLCVGGALILMTYDLFSISDLVIKHKYAVMLSSFVFFCFYGVIQYVFLRKFFFESFRKEFDIISSNEQIQKRKLDRTNENSRLFVYVLSILQDKGRFLDFISEDLSKYKDAKIGAISRLIHENCKKSMSDYFSIEHIVAQNEGEKIILPSFDIKTIKFIGKVFGEPPYTGVVRHKGWRIRFMSRKLPGFATKIHKLNTIYPAQIEIL